MVFHGEDRIFTYALCSARWFKVFFTTPILNGSRACMRITAKTALDILLHLAQEIEVLTFLSTEYAYSYTPCQGRRKVE